MADSQFKILLVEPEPMALERVLRALIDRFDTHITCVPTAEECLQIQAEDPHDLIIAEMELPDSVGLELTQDLLARRQVPIILLAESPSYDEAVDAIRLGIRDLFAKPFRVSALMEAVDRSLEGGRVRRRHRMRYRQMRGLLRKVIRERRELNQRIELICRDFVGAHRKLVDRVLEIEQLKSQ